MPLVYSNDQVTYITIEPTTINEVVINDNIKENKTHDYQIAWFLYLSKIVSNNIRNIGDLIP